MPPIHCHWLWEKMRESGLTVYEAAQSMGLAALFRDVEFGRAWLPAGEESEGEPINDELLLEIL